MLYLVINIECEILIQVWVFLMLRHLDAVCIIIVQETLKQPQGVFLSVGLYEPIMRSVLPPTFNALL